MDIKDIINSFGVADHVDNAKPGQIALANITQNVAESVFLSQYAVRHSDENNIAQARRMLAPDAPIVDDGTAYEYRFWPLESAYTTMDYNGLKRAVGGDYKAISDSTEKRAGTLDDIGLCIVVENDHLKRIQGYKELLVRKLVGTIERATFIEALSLFDMFATDTTVSVGTQDLGSVVRGILASEAVTPNAALIGAKAWNLYVSGVESKMTAGALAAPKTPAEFGSRYGVDVLVPNGRKTAADGTFPLIVNDKIYLAYSSGVSTDDMSNMKVFRPGVGFKVYESPHAQGRKTMITVSTKQGLRVTSTAGANVITVTE
jgi:hypothetical protein